jgi:hypothetical protein
LLDVLAERRRLPELEHTPEEKIGERQTGRATAE